jgi:hypothetical protein
MADWVQVNLRIRNELHRRLEREARANGASLNNEMRVRLERSLEAESLRTVNNIVDDMEINWHRYAERFMALDLGEDILKALEDRDFAKARALALALRKGQERIARERAQRLQWSRESSDGEAA